MNRTAFHDHGRAVPIRAFQLQYLLRNFIIAVPRKIQSARKTPPSIERPIDAAPPPLAIDNKGRTAVPHPGIVAAQFHEPYLSRQACARVLKLSRRNPDRDRFAAADRRCDRSECRLRRLGAEAPIVRSLRP